MKIETWEAIEDIVKAGGVLVDKGSSYERYVCFNNKGQIHRVDGPAIVRVDGYKSWLLNDMHHREGDAPAVIAADGALYYMQNDKYHRENGPAIIEPNGVKKWYLQGYFLKEFRS